MLLASPGVIAALLPEMAGVGSLTPIKATANIVHSDEVLSAFLELETALL